MIHVAPGTVLSTNFAFGVLGSVIAYYAWAFSRVFPTRPWLAAAGGLVALAGGVAMWTAAMVALLQVLRS